MFCFQGSVKYQGYFLDTLINSICDKQAEVRQAAAYGVGVMAMFGGEAYARVFEGRVAHCQSVFLSPSHILCRAFKHLIIPVSKCLFFFQYF